MENPETSHAYTRDSAPAFSAQKLEYIYEAVFRQSTQQPGFYYEDMGSHMTSSAFRQRMVELKEGLTAVSQRRANLRLNYQWMGRFSHQHTSQFHRDSAHPHSFLMLGYEPTAVDSRVYVADFSKLIEQHGIPLATYFGGSQEVNVAAEAPSIAPYVTELTPFPKDHYRLLVLNNSKSFQKPTFGMFHRGEVQQKQSAEDRIINSIMLYMANPEEEEQHTQQDISNFVNTQQVNR